MNQPVYPATRARARAREMGDLALVHRRVWLRAPAAPYIYNR